MCSYSPALLIGQIQRFDRSPCLPLDRQRSQPILHATDLLGFTLSVPWPRPSSGGSRCDWGPALKSRSTECSRRLDGWANAGLAKDKYTYHARRENRRRPQSDRQGRSMKVAQLKRRPEGTAGSRRRPDAPSSSRHGVQSICSRRCYIGGRHDGLPEASKLPLADALVPRGVMSGVFSESQSLIFDA